MSLAAFLARAQMRNYESGRVRARLGLRVRSISRACRVCPTWPGIPKSRRQACATKIEDCGESEGGVEKSAILNHVRGDSYSKLMDYEWKPPSAALDLVGTVDQMDFSFTGSVRP